MTLEQRVTALEQIVEKIIALPHLSNLAGDDSRNFVILLNMSLDSDKKKLASENLSDDERKELEEKISRTEYLVSPALDVKLIGDKKQDTQELDEHIRKIVNEEIRRRWLDVLKATYPPELWQALQSKFPDILSDSREYPPLRIFRQVSIFE